MEETIKAFKESLMLSKDVLIDFSETKIDLLTKNDSIKDIPIVKTVYTAFRIGKNLKDRNLLNQTRHFLSELNNGDIDRVKLEEYKREIENNPKKCDKELGRVLLILNEFIDKEKSYMLSKLFKAYINGKINWELFCEYAEIVNRLFIEDLKMIKDLKYDALLYYGFSNNNYFPKVNRLESLGIIERIDDKITKKEALEKANKSEEIKHDGYLKITIYGKNFLDIIK